MEQGLESPQFRIAAGELRLAQVIDVACLRPGRFVDEGLYASEEVTSEVSEDLALSVLMVAKAHLLALLKAQLGSAFVDRGEQALKGLSLRRDFRHSSLAVPLSPLDHV